MTTPQILVVKLSALGDFVLALAAMRRIRDAHPGAHITLLTTPAFEKLARPCPYFDAVDPGGRPKGLGEWIALRRRLRAARFTRVYDLQTSTHSNRIFQALRPGPPPWSGVAWGCALPHANPRRDHLHTLERQADQLKFAGVWPDAPTTPGSAPGPDVSWLWGGAAVPRPTRLGAAPRPMALLAPGGSAHRPDKRWPVERFAELAQGLTAIGYDVAVVGGPQENELARAIQAVEPKAHDLTGKTELSALAILGAKAALAVGNDTGPIHLIAAAGAPTVVLFSKASAPALSAPRGVVVTLQSDDLSALSVAQVSQAAASVAGSLSTAP